MAVSKRVRPTRKSRRGQNSNRPESLRFYLYAVNGILRGARVTLRVVCCHATDARAMVATRQPELDKLRVTRGKLIHFIAVGDHTLID
jgi:hypothetical protein